MSAEIEKVVVTTTKSKLAELGMLLDWIIDNRSIMDEAMISLESNEITTAINNWSSLVDRGLET